MNEIPETVIHALYVFRAAHQALAKTPRPTTTRSNYFSLSSDERLAVATGRMPHPEIADEWKHYEAVNNACKEAVANLDTCVMAWVTSDPKLP